MKTCWILNGIPHVKPKKEKRYPDTSKWQHINLITHLILQFFMHEIHDIDVRTVSMHWGIRAHKGKTQWDDRWAATEWNLRLNLTQHRKNGIYKHSMNWKIEFFLPFKCVCVELPPQNISWKKILINKKKGSYVVIFFVRCLLDLTLHLHCQVVEMVWMISHSERSRLLQHKAHYFHYRSQLVKLKYQCPELSHR